MYRTLFDVAGLAMLGWLLLILLPGWKVTRRIAETAVFPVYLCVLYAVGIAAVIAEMGPGFMRDFGSADGVLALLATGPVALVAWIHILAFDQLVGVLIYRDNIKHRFVPLPVQSVLLVMTLMLGPLGFLAYWAVRTIRTRSLVAWGERDAVPAAAAPASAVTAPHFRAVAVGETAAAKVFGLWRRERALVGLGLLGFAFAAVTGAVAVANGGWLLAPEGRLLEAVKFDVAIGIYLLTLALILPLAPFSARGRRRWVAWSVGLGVFSYGMENVQAWRGLDPRFSTVAGPVDQALGGVFFLSALGLLVLFAVLLLRFFRDDAIPDHPALRLSLRYAAGGAAIAFGVGIAMSGMGGRTLGAAGDLMPVHAAGFHALQAVPLVALVLGAGFLSAAEARRWTHVAGAGWLLLCAGLVLQAVRGEGIVEPSPALAASVAGALTWSAALAYALWVRTSRAPAMA
jgi:hypothetical protein